MAFETIDFTSDIQYPNYHLNANSVLAFYKCPYTFYWTYIKEVYEKPPVIKHPVEMILKGLFFGGEDATLKLDGSSPINPKTHKPFGADTQKYEDWARGARAQGLTPVHKDHIEKAKAIYAGLKQQVDGGFSTTLAHLVKPGGQFSIHGTANIDNNNCYAHVDYISAGGCVCQLVCTPTLDRDSRSGLDSLVNEAIFKLSFNRLVFSKLGLVDSKMYLILVETNAPYRAGIVYFDDDHPSQRVALSPTGASSRAVMATIQAISAAHNSIGIDAWKSPWHHDAAFIAT